MIVKNGLDHEIYTNGGNIVFSGTPALQPIKKIDHSKFVIITRHILTL